MSQYIQTGAFGLPKTITKQLQAAAAKLPGGGAASLPGAAAVAADADKPWYMRPTTWLLGGGLALGAFLLLGKSEPRSNPRTAKRGWGVRRKSYAKLRAPLPWSARRRMTKKGGSRLLVSTCQGCSALTRSKIGYCQVCQGYLGMKKRVARSK